MNSSALQWLRKLLLIANGLTFLVFAISTLVNATFTATVYGYTLNGVGGANEFHAVYMGFWLGLTTGFFLAVRHYRVAILGDVMLMLVLFQSLGRVYSFVVDGIPPTRFVVFFAAELLAAGVGLMIRPRDETAPVAHPTLA